MNPVNELSDAQLYALAINDCLSHRLNEVVLSEFTRRNFTPEYISELKLGYERIMPADNTGLTVGEKTLIIIASPTLLIWFYGPFLFMLIGPVTHSWFANKYISKGQPRRWRQYWQYLSIGFLIWTTIFLLIVRLFLKQ